MFLHFSFFSLENKLFGVHQTPFLPVEVLEFLELKTPLVYTFFPPRVLSDLLHRTPAPQDPPFQINFKHFSLDL